jgi:hypothetical protein
MTINSLDLSTTAAQEALVWDGPSDEDMAWYLEQTYVDPAERVDY